MESSIPQESHSVPIPGAHRSLTPTNHSSLSSEPFEIIAQSGKRFFVHSDILGAYSEPLRTTTTGVWKEASERRIDLSDWDADTVGRFVEFLYVGSYHVPESTPDGYDRVWGGRLDDADTSGNVRGLAEEELAHENVLLAHAKVYALAQYKDVGGLKILALERLKAELEENEGHMMSGEMAGNTIELLEYVYSHTDSLTNSEEPLRELVSTFAAGEFEELDQADMWLLLQEGGDFPSELIKKMAGRICNTETRLSQMEEELAETQAECFTRIDEFGEVTARLDIAEVEVQRWRNEATALRARVRQLELANAEEVRKAFNLKKTITDMKMFLEDKKAMNSVPPFASEVGAGVAERRGDMSQFLPLAAQNTISG